jgi:hypothetical protein
MGWLQRIALLEPWWYQAGTVKANTDRQCHPREDAVHGNGVGQRKSLVCRRRNNPSGSTSPSLWGGGTRSVRGSHLGLGGVLSCQKSEHNEKSWLYESFQYSIK